MQLLINSKRLLSTFYITGLVLLTGCSWGEFQSIHHVDKLPTNTADVVSIDSKQRVVLSNPINQNSTDTDTALRFCAEPPPDIFTALAISLSADASQDNLSEIALKLGFTSSENAATIERTQTLNILREAMYRNCERWLSGAITKQEFIIQAARDQQLIVQVLAIEQITGVTRAKATALTTVAKAINGNASVIKLSDAKKVLDTKQETSKQVAKEALNLAPEGACEASPIPVDNLPSGVTLEQANAKNSKCAEAAQLTQQAKEAQEYYDLIAETVKNQNALLSEVSGKLITAAQNIAKVSDSIADKVVQIVETNQNFDEIGMTCVLVLRTETDDTDSELKTACQRLVRQAIAQLETESKVKQSLFRVQFDKVAKDQEAVQLRLKIAEATKAEAEAEAAKAEAAKAKAEAAEAEAEAEAAEAEAEAEAAEAKAQQLNKQL